jgi:hypothetical protein
MKKPETFAWGRNMKVKTISWWAIEKPSEYRRYLRAAKRAGRRGIPDPSRSTEAASCFGSAVAWATDQAAQRASEFMDVIHDDVLFVRRYGHILDSAVELGPNTWANGGTEAERRQRAVDAELAGEVRAREASVQLRHAEFQMDLGSVAGAWKRLDGDMRDVFRVNYIHEHHFARIKFPVLDLRSLAYSNSSGIDIVSMLRLRESDGPESNESAREVES